MYFFSNLLCEWITRNGRGWDAGKGQKRRCGQGLDRLDQRIAPAYIYVKGLKPPPIEQAADRKA